MFGPWYQPTGSDQVGQARSLRTGDVPGSAVNTYLHYLPCGDQQGVEAQQPPDDLGLPRRSGYAITTYFNPMICTNYSPAYGQAVAADVLTENALGQPYVYRYAASPTSFFNVAQFDYSAPARDGFLRRTSSPRRSATATTAGWRTSASTRRSTRSRRTG